MVKYNLTRYIFGKDFVITIEKSVYAVIIVYILMIGFIAFNRDSFNYATETDYLGGFVPEALRIIKGEPLLVHFHPPFYALSIAVVYTVTGDWMKAGMIVSVLSSFLLMSASYHFFKKSFGAVEAVGSVILLLLSSTYLSYSMSATSDVLAVSLTFIAFYCIEKSYHNPRSYWAILTGIVVGISVLTRSNGIVLLGFVLFYITFRRYYIQFDKKIIHLAAGIIMPFCVWIIFALISNSPVMPIKTYENLALTYYSEDDRIGADARKAVSEGFTSSIGVLFQNPAHTIKVYVKDLAQTAKRLLSASPLLPVPFAQLALFGFFTLGLMFMFRSHYCFVIFLNLLFLFLLLNFKAFEERYYLYFLPFFGAGIANLFRIIYSKLNYSFYARILFVGFISAIIAYSGKQAIFDVYAYQKHHTSTDALAAAACLNLAEKSNENIIISRKPHISFYSDVENGMFPNVNNVQELKSEIYKKYLENYNNIFLFFGKSEANHRKELQPVLFDTENGLAWLAPICSGDEEGGWVLYRVREIR